MISTVVFDLGGVLIDWNPRHLYRKLFDDADAMEHFLAAVCSHEWNAEQDGGRTIADAIAALLTRFPEHGDLITAYYERFDEMMSGPIAGTLQILTELRERDVPLYALTNWSAETFPHAERRFAFLGWFRDTVVSGREKMRKPDPRIFSLMIKRFGLTPGETAYIDDSEHNIDAANDAGLRGIHFTAPDALRRDIAGLGLL